MRVAITGASGLIGTHLMARLRATRSYRVDVVGRSAFANPMELDDVIREADAVVHLAGVNRGEEAALEEANLALADALVASCSNVRAAPHVIFSNSTHCDRDSAYGRSKRGAAATLAAWAAEVGARFDDLILPHVFGEYGRPFHNSVVATFCYQLANRDAPTVDEDGGLELLHAQRVAGLIDQLLEAPYGGEGGHLRPSGVKMPVSDLLHRLTSFADEYRSGRVPDLRETIDLDLFNTYRSFTFPHAFPAPLQLHSDERGVLFEALKSLNGGQVFLSETNPGFTRGGHFHLRKIERFLVLRGKGRIRLRRLFTDEVSEFAVDGSSPAFVDIPTLHTHDITNTGDDPMLTLFWAHEIFDPSSPDTYPEPVVEAACA